MLADHAAPRLLCGVSACLLVLSRWGFDDTAFRVNSELNVELTGTRYTESFPAYGSRVLPRFCEFITEVLGVDTE